MNLRIPVAVILFCVACTACVRSEPSPSGVAPKKPAFEDFAVSAHPRRGDGRPRVELDLSSVSDPVERHLLTLIHRSSSFRMAYHWNPTLVIAATNALLKEGSKRAVEILLHYVELEKATFEGKELRRAEEFTFRAFPIAMMLFQGDTLAEIPIFGPTDSHFALIVGPICTVDDLPFLTHLGYAGSGFSDDLGQFKRYLDLIQKEGKFREAPLSPKGEPFKATRKVETLHREEYEAAGGEPGSQDYFYRSYQWQCLRCTGAAWPDPEENWDLFEKAAAEKQFSTFENWYAAKGLKWDEAKSKFVSPNLKKD